MLISLIEDYLALVDQLLYTNQTAEDLQSVCELGQRQQKGYSVEDRLLTQRRKLVVAKSVCTDLITTAYCSITTAHSRKNKSKQLIKEQYY